MVIEISAWGAKCLTRVSASPAEEAETRRRRKNIYIAIVDFSRVVTT